MCVRDFGHGVHVGWGGCRFPKRCVTMTAATTGRAAGQITASRSGFERESEWLNRRVGRAGLFFAHLWRSLYHLLHERSWGLRLRITRRAVPVKF